METFEGSDGRLYERTPRGVVEVDDPVRHAKRLLSETEGFTITGLRLNDPKDPAAGAVVTFSPEEARTVVTAVQNVLKKRAKEK